MECGGIFAWTRGRRAYIKAHAKIPWTSFTTKNKAYVKLVRSNMPLQTRDDFKYSERLRFCLRQRQKQLWRDRQTEEQLFSLQPWTCLKKAREKRLPACTYGICGQSFLLWGRAWTSTKQTNKKKTIHSPAISGILSLFGANKILDAHWLRPPDKKLDFSTHCQQEVCNPYIWRETGPLLPD